ncbi:hypothetical protein HYH02_000217 [Chlamydomonas schloesseri]|uniref:Uncharacterized protein n=1 Tax=Chlamydomonas schloesseri TaxID=2026947 RepID=A0A836B880_9CHLO|nr:hypothetical protein HYH02_000217 [Chlamydomonas schloesseri]|eukprot:KAG2450114.1 hypothetical protein HYH02_000217 [Chlamydomonas schloesseri]
MNYPTLPTSTARRLQDNVVCSNATLTSLSACASLSLASPNATMRARINCEHTEDAACREEASLRPGPYPLLAGPGSEAGPQL